jgi:transaldolase
MNQLEQLSAMTIVVADTGDLKAIAQYKPTDSTTNPSLVLKALNQLKEENRKEEYDRYFQSAIDYVNKRPDIDTLSRKDKLNYAVDRMAVEFGRQILDIVPGYVSTELDARLSFDIENSVKRAVNIVAMYTELGIENVRDRVLIKVASTWEGFEIARILRVEHQIKCNMTLLFSIWQAAAAAQIAGAYLVSPFVGRITDWHKAKNNVTDYDAYTDDPGVLSVRNIFDYYKLIKSDTIVMGASFRNKDQILALAGCDRLTIGPKFLQQLRESKDKVTQFLTREAVVAKDENNTNSDANANANEERKETDNEESSDITTGSKLDVCEKNYRWGMCSDACGTEKLADGIRRFAADIVKLENILKQKFGSE